MHASPARPKVAVVGSGVSGLLAARRLAQRGMAVSLFEADARLGGQVRTIDFGGHRVDVGAEALHAIAPILALIDELGLRDRLVEADEGFTWIWDGRRLRRLPAGVGPAGPTRLWPVITSGALSPRGFARAAVEPLLPATVVDIGSDQSVGGYLTRRFGHQVTDRLVDPVLGGLHAGDVNRLSMQATAPHLAQLARDHRSLVLAHRARQGGSPPSFVSFADGLSTFTDALLAGTDVETAPSTPLRCVRPTPTGFILIGETDGDPVEVDAVVLAISATAAARLLEHSLPQASWHLSRVVERAACVGTVVAAYHRDQVSSIRALAGKGMLVASTAGRYLKAATFLSTKWPHLRPPDRVLIRLSVGRAGDPTLSQLDDEEVVARASQDLADATGLTATPVKTHLERWPQTMAQLEVGHLDRVATARRALLDEPLVAGRMAVAGASYDGLGIAACMRSGEAAAAAIASALADTHAFTIQVAP